MSTSHEIPPVATKATANTTPEPGQTLVRKDLANAVYKLGTMSREDAAKITNLVLDTMVETIAGGEELKIHGFGKFVILNKNARIGRNPRTGVEAEISARRSISFRPSPNLVDAVNKK